MATRRRGSDSTSICLESQDRFFVDFSKVSFGFSNPKSVIASLTPSFGLQAFAKLLELGVDRGEDGLARLVKRAKEEGVSVSTLAPRNAFEGRCPFAGKRKL